MKIATLALVSALSLGTVGLGTVAFAPAASAAPRGYTAEQVAQHNTAADCWTIVGKRVYDVTDYVTRHPGGSSAIAALCGKDGSRMFLGQHSGDASALRALKPYRIGKLLRAAAPAYQQ